MTDGEFEEAYAQFAPALYRSIQRIVNNAAISEDIMQETFIRFLQKADTDTPQKYRAFLFQIGHNLAVDYLKKHRRVLNYENLDSKIDERDSFQEADYRLWREIIVQKMQKSNPKYLQIFLLRVDFQLTYEEISEQLKIPIRTLMRLTEGMKRILREVL